MTTMTTTSRKMTTIGIFVSSVQKELNEERIAVRDYITTDPLLRIYFEPFLFESIPAVDREPEELYLSEVDGCSIYLGIFGNEYGPENKLGVSPVEREFERATEKSKHRVLCIQCAVPLSVEEKRAYENQQSLIEL